MNNKGLSKKVFVGLSGGVDSSVAAYLLKKQGYDVTGVFLRCFNVDGCAETDAEDARRVAEHIGIPFYAWNFEKEYKKRVVKYMVDGYRRGITPNPDIACNREIKFGLFLKKALAMGADYVATGHYVRLAKKSDGYRLYAGKDKNKDQSYFLWTLGQNDLKHCLFPIGDYLKPKVRTIAKRAGLPTATKKDSQGICFLGKVTLADFLAAYIRPKRGAVVDVRGRKIGEHNGAYFYTLGQRHGIGAIKHEKGQTEHKLLYVTAKNVWNNTITMAGADDAELYRKEILLSAMNFISKKPARKSMRVLARIRYRQPLVQATLLHAKRRYKLVFKTPQKFVAPGQSAVFYSSSGQMLGGGVIL